MENKIEIKKGEKTPAQQPTAQHPSPSFLSPCAAPSFLSLAQQSGPGRARALPSSFIPSADSWILPIPLSDRVGPHVSITSSLPSSSSWDVSEQDSRRRRPSRFPGIFFPTRQSSPYKARGSSLQSSFVSTSIGEALAAINAAVWISRARASPLQWRARFAALPMN